MSMCVLVHARFRTEVISRGDVALLSNANLFVPDAPWYLHGIWANGHIGVVRSILYDEEVSLPLKLACKGRCKNRAHFGQIGVVVTGGEDNIINAWSCISPEARSESDAMNIEPILRKRGLEREDGHVRDSSHPRFPSDTIMQEGVRASSTNSCMIINMAEVPY